MKFYIHEYKIMRMQTTFSKNNDTFICKKMKHYPQGNIEVFYLLYHVRDGKHVLIYNSDDEIKTIDVHPNGCLILNSNRQLRDWNEPEEEEEEEKEEMFPATEEEVSYVYPYVDCSDDDVEEDEMVGRDYPDCERDERDYPDEEED